MLRPWTREGRRGSFSDLPLDYYASGPSYLYSRNSWGSDATAIFFSLGQGTGNGHWHKDAGSFQVERGDKQLAPEHTGYGDTWADGTANDATASHNGITYNGVGLANAYQDGPRGSSPCRVPTLMSMPRLTCPTPIEPTPRTIRTGMTIRMKAIRSGNSSSSSPWRRCSSMDRLESTSASVTKSFLLHTPQNPTIVDGNHVTMVNGDQELWLTTLNSGYSYNVVHEGNNGGDACDMYRLQDSTSGSLDDVMLHAIQVGPANGSAVNVSIASQDANTWTITFTSPTSGTAKLVLNKGTFSLGGSFGYAASGTPQVTPLTDTVQSLTVTEDGPVWGSFPDPTPTPTPGTQGAWKGVYGADGFYLAQDPSSNNPSLPSYATVALTGNSNYTWAGSTSESRGLQKAAAGSTDRLAACWYAASSFSIDVHLTDGQAHQVALYALDWDAGAANARTETVQAIDDATGAVLDTRTVSTFRGGPTWSGTSRETSP